MGSSPVLNVGATVCWREHLAPVRQCEFLLNWQLTSARHVVRCKKAREIATGPGRIPDDPYV